MKRREGHDFCSFSSATRYRISSDNSHIHPVLIEIVDHWENCLSDWECSLWDQGKSSYQAGKQGRGCYTGSYFFVYIGDVDYETRKSIDSCCKRQSSHSRDVVELLVPLTDRFGCQELLHDVFPQESLSRISKLMKIPGTRREGSANATHALIAGLFQAKIRSPRSSSAHCRSSHIFQSRRSQLSGVKGHITYIVFLKKKKSFRRDLIFSRM